MLAWQLQSLAGTVRHKAYRKRVLTRDVRWSFGNGFEIAVALYAMLQTAVKGSHTYLKAQNNEPLRSEGAYICNDTGENWTVSGKSRRPPCISTFHHLVGEILHGNCLQTLAAAQYFVYS